MALRKCSKVSAVSISSLDLFSDKKCRLASLSSSFAVKASLIAKVHSPFIFTLLTCVQNMYVFYKVFGHLENQSATSHVTAISISEVH